MILHIIRLTIWHELFLEFWLVDTCFFAHPHDQRAVNRLENVRQLNIMPGKELDFPLSHRQPLINIHMVKLCGDSIYRTLKIIFKILFKPRVFSAEWKKANIVSGIIDVWKTIDQFLFFQYLAKHLICLYKICLNTF